MKSFDIYTDASTKQLGSVITQDNRPIAFFSGKLYDPQSKYTVTELELLAIVESGRGLEVNYRIDESIKVGLHAVVVLVRFQCCRSRSRSKSMGLNKLKQYKTVQVKNGAELFCREEKRTKNERCHANEEKVSWNK